MTHKTSLHVKYINNKRAMCECLWHDDTNASLEVTLDGPHEGEYYCHGCHRAGTLVKFVLDKLKSKKHKDAVDERVAEVDWESLNAQYMHDFFWVETKRYYPFHLDNKRIFNSLNMGWDGSAFTFPERNASGEIIGMMRRFPDGFKTMVDGSRRGLTISEFPVSLPVFITEGLSDTATLLDLGYYAIGRPNDMDGFELVQDWILENAVDIEDFLPVVHNDQIYIMADNDSPGLKSAEQLAEQLDLPDKHILIPGWDGDDIRSYRKGIGSEAIQIWINERISR